jgi:hypothetical protein
MNARCGFGWSVFTAAAMAVMGCATQTQLERVEVPQIAGPFSIRVVPCVDRTGTATRDVAADATMAFQSRLAASREFRVANDARFELTCDVTAFVEGSALKRWILPGWGATSCQVAAMVTDQSTGHTIFTGRSTADVSSGGLYTVGAETYIVDAAIADLVAQMEKAVAARSVGSEPSSRQ